MKVSIIGGGGLVGSCAAFALQCGGVVREVTLLDINANLAAGHALDLMHGTPSVADQLMTSGGYEQVADSDVICITAGLRRKPDESRLDLINRNTDLFVGILDEIKKVGTKPGAICVVVSNPVDILTYVAAKKLGLPATHVIGLGTQLDTIRFCSLIADAIGTAPTQTKGLILGEHGDSMVPIWSSAAVGSLSLEKYPGWGTALAEKIFTRTKNSGAECLSKKGGAGFAVGIAIRDVIHAIALDQNRLMPVSTVQDGQCYGIDHVAISVPTVVGRTGAKQRVEVDLWPKELQGLKASAAAIKPTLETVLKRIG
ncbi:lactate/malate dehydrogenase family protein [Pirellulaceae bacterium SH449]|jgi:L-lactate dehydrogenase